MDEKLIELKKLSLGFFNKIDSPSYLRYLVFPCQDWETFHDMNVLNPAAHFALDQIGLD